MCINLIQHSPKIAEENIVAYKVLEIRYDNFLYTPFQLMHVELNKLYTNIEQEQEGFYRLTSGVYHLFSSIEDAILLKEYSQRNYISEFTIVKAIIPKGTKYYIGKSEFGSEELDRKFQHESYGVKSVIYEQLDA